jgi:hypothetical protein
MKNEKRQKQQRSETKLNGWTDEIDTCIEPCTCCVDDDRWAFKKFVWVGGRKILFLLSWYSLDRNLFFSLWPTLFVARGSGLDGVSCWFVDWYWDLPVVFYKDKDVLFSLDETKKKVEYFISKGLHFLNPIEIIITCIITWIH